MVITYFIFPHTRTVLDVQMGQVICSKVNYSLPWHALNKNNLTWKVCNLDLDLCIWIFWQATAQSNYICSIQKQCKELCHKLVRNKMSSCRILLFSSFIVSLSFCIKFGGRISETATYQALEITQEEIDQLQHSKYP